LPTDSFLVAIARKYHFDIPLICWSILHWGWRQWRWKNFIMNLTTEAIRRDTSIVNGGWRCGDVVGNSKININISSGRFTQCTCLRIKRVASGLSCWWCPDYLGYLRPVLTVFGW
jgi:hypothetical protein